MKRIVLVAATVAGLITGCITTVASAATHHASGADVTCHTLLTSVAPRGANFSTPGEPSGYQYGATRCSGLGSGATEVKYSTDDAGVVSGKIQHWFKGGTLYGTFSLTQSAQTGPPTSSTFASSSESGTVTLGTGQGSLYGMSAMGTMSCTTPDAQHYFCTEKFSVSAS